MDGTGAGITAAIGAGITVARLASTMGVPSGVSGTMDPTPAGAHGGSERSTIDCIGAHPRLSRALQVWGIHDKQSRRPAHESA